MRVAFRVDSSTQIGTGHLMRCLALADALRERGVHTRFVGLIMPAFIEALLHRKQHELRLLELDHAEQLLGDLKESCWSGTDQANDASNTLRALSDNRWDWLIVDHHSLDARWESVLRQSAQRILVIDDLANRHHDCDALLDQNFHPNVDSHYTGKIPAYCRKLLGPRYALLGHEFREWRQRVEPRKGKVKRVLIFFEGLDAHNQTVQAINALAGLNRDYLRVDLVIAVSNPFRAEAESICKEHGLQYCVHATCSTKLIAAADLAIGGGGTAIWERCCLGVPTLTTADDRIVFDAAAEALLYAPGQNDETANLFERHVTSLIDNEALRRAISRKGMEMVDGRGVLRVIRHMGCSAVQVRPASAGDSNDLFKWRNHPSIRMVSRNPELIQWEVHENWFASVLADPDRELLIGHRDGQPVGVVRFDIHNKEAEVSIYLVPGVRQPGIGGDLLLSAERWLMIHRCDVTFFRSQVLGDNIPSHRLFEAGGYNPRSTDYSKRIDQI